MNNNNNFIEQSFINNLKFIVRDVVREELQAQGIPVNSQFTPNYGPVYMTKTPMFKPQDDTNLCINACKASNNCNSCIASSTCIVRFDSTTFNTDEFYNRYGYRLINGGMTIRQFLSTPEVVRFIGVRQLNDVVKISIMTVDNCRHVYLTEANLKSWVNVLDLKIVEINNKFFKDKMFENGTSRYTINITAYAAPELICTNDHNCDSCTKKCNNGAYVVPPDNDANSSTENVEFNASELYPHCTSYNIIKCCICEDTTCCVHPKDTVRDFINTHNTNLNKLSFILSEELYPDYEKSERELMPYDDNGKTIYCCDAIDILLTEEQLLDEYVVVRYDDEYVYIKKC